MDIKLNSMLFFQQLDELLNKNGSVNMSITTTGGIMTVSICPVIKDGAAQLSPIIVSGTPLELDEDLVNTISKPLDQVNTLNVYLEQFNESVQEIVKNKKTEVAKSHGTKVAEKAETTTLAEKPTNVQPETKRRGRGKAKEVPLEDVPKQEEPQKAPVEEISQAQVQAMTDQTKREHVVPTKSQEISFDEGFSDTPEDSGGFDLGGQGFDVDADVSMLPDINSDIHTQGDEPEDLVINFDNM